MPEINKILFITLSNIGDAILTLPALDYLKVNYPQSKITVMTGLRPKEIFEKDPYIEKFIVYDKHAKLKQKLKIFKELYKEGFDMVVDLRNSLYGLLIPARYRVSPFLIIAADIQHMSDRHLYKVMSCQPLALRAHPSVARQKQLSEATSINIKPEDEEYINKILKDNKISEQDFIIAIAAGARSHIKKWAKEKFTQLVPLLVKEFKAKVVLVGDKDDAKVARFISENCAESVLDLSAETNLSQLASLLRKSRFIITNDSAVLHLASYLNRPIVAVFGPTNELKYGPWSENYSVVKRDIICRPCEKAQCRFNRLACMQLIKVEDVFRQLRKLSVISNQLTETSKKHNFRRILVVRTDRIGDVLLSTPVIKALREEYPSAYLAMMVDPYAKDIVDGNPDLDEIIIYDKGGLHKSWHRSAKFAKNLKKRRFDLAVILHPTNRVHLITFFAGIPKRLGYNRKLGFLLTDRIQHTKQLGEKHERDYNLELLSYLGITAAEKELFMPIKSESEEWVKELFKEEGILKTDRLLAVHPGASCPSKIWPTERVSQVADRLIDKYGFKVLVISGPKDILLAQDTIRHMRHQAINLGGKTSVSQLASILKRCALFISNDSGPVHVASAVGTAVISIFGRNQKGLSPKRWGPLGKKDKIIHKEVGCIKCLAHNCRKDFECLKAINVDDVIEAADSILTN